MRIGLALLLIAQYAASGVAQQAERTYPTTINLDDQLHRQVVVDREAGQYLGHPTTCLLEDGKTILCVYPKGHGTGVVVYKRSIDGGADLE